MFVLTREKRKALAELFKCFKPEVRLAILFGSYGTAYQREESDLDFAVLFSGKADINDEMSLLVRLSELLEYENIDLVNLNKAPVTIQFKALEGETIYERDPLLSSDFVEKTLKVYADYAPVLAKFDRELLSREIRYDHD